jgi:hypothetical protein
MNPISILSTYTNFNIILPTLSIPSGFFPSDKLTNPVAPEPEGSSPHSQQPANGPYSEPGQSTPHPPPNQSP